MPWRIPAQGGKNIPPSLDKREGDARLERMSKSKPSIDERLAFNPDREAEYCIARWATDGGRLYWYCGDVYDRPVHGGTRIPVEKGLVALTQWFANKGS
jgi:hypothetical protein